MQTVSWQNWVIYALFAIVMGLGTLELNSLNSNIAGLKIELATANSTIGRQGERLATLEADSRNNLGFQSRTTGQLDRIEARLNAKP